MSSISKKLFFSSIGCLVSFYTWGQGLVLAQPPIVGIKDPYENIQINCKSLIPESPSQNRRKFIKKYSAYVAKQTFAFNYLSIDFDLSQINECFTDNGWTQFKTALDHSGNVALVKNNLLTSSSQIIEPIAIQHIKDEARWEVDVPIQIVYQNDKKKITQMISVHLNILELPDRHVSVLQIMGKPIAQDSRYAIDPSWSNHPNNNTQPIINKPLTQDQAPSNLAPAAPPAPVKKLPPAQDPINLNAQAD